MGLTPLPTGISVTTGWTSCLRADDVLPLSRAVRSIGSGAAFGSASAAEATAPSTSRPMANTMANMVSILME